MEHFEELKEYLTLNGRSISKRFSESAFVRAKKTHLIDFVKSETSTLHPDQTFAIRCWAILRNAVEQHSCQTCNAPIFGKTENGWDRYCNKACANTDPNMSSKIKERRKKVDESLADEKRKVTMKERFGVEYASQRESHKEALSKVAEKNRREKFPLLLDSDWLANEHIVKRRPVTDTADEVGSWYGTVHDAMDRLGVPYTANCSGYNVSGAENDLYNFVLSICPDAVQGDRKTIGKEIDIFIPSKMVAIEFNGLFWHSIGFPETKITPSYHKDKMVLCNAKGIRLIHINENEWRDDREKVMSIIRNSLSATSIKIGARTLNVVPLDIERRRQFFEDNHLKGDAGASISHGLERDGILYAAISLSKPRFSTKADWEVVRYATTLNHSVRGGFTKLIKHFRSIHSGSILSYCDLMKGTGNLYKESGFKCVSATQPGYFWTDKKNLFGRTVFMKDSLSKKLQKFDPDLSESENMMLNGYRKFFDCGNSVWILEDNENK